MVKKNVFIRPMLKIFSFGEEIFHSLYLYTIQSFKNKHKLHNEISHSRTPSLLVP